MVHLPIPHKLQETGWRQTLVNKFEVISLKTNFIWVPYSPNLNPLDFFLWGHLKDVVYRDKPLSIQELKESITTTHPENKQ